MRNVKPRPPSTMAGDEHLNAFQQHMERCMAAVTAPMQRADIKVTIIVRAPEALPEEAMISTTDNLSVALAALAHFEAKGQSDG